ncbi:MAG: hypothetical protein JXA71_09030 [Chitinispirillaceae bacterium]|nr:hypothetical protein [Chitinispirillaceae bacterium]
MRCPPVSGVFRPNNRFSPILSTPFMLIAGALFLLGCDAPPEEKMPLTLTARLVEENGVCNLVVRNDSKGELTVCKRNFYDAVSCLDVRRFPDTAEFGTEQVFGRNALPAKREIITLDDYCRLAPGQEARVPLDLRPIAAHCRLGDTVYLAAFYKNIDPALCSRVQVHGLDKAVQDYCRLLHVIPTLDNHYWSGEIRTPYLPVNLCKYAPKKSAVQRRSSKARVIRRSKTHPLDRPVF